MGGAASMGGITSSDGRERYFCHQCHRVFVLGSNTEGIICPHCDSPFVEEVNANERNGPSDLFMSRQGQMLTSDQSRRIMNATALLRLLEAQLRDELEFLQRPGLHGSNVVKKQMTHAMKFKCRTINIDMDQICSQPSCPVCTTDFVVDCEVTRLPCSHLFHQGCVMPWLDMKQNCPICRAEISPAVLELEEYEKYPCKELIEKLGVLEVEITDVETKTSVDLAFMLHKHLKQLEIDENNREVEEETARLAAEQQRRANFQRYMNDTSHHYDHMNNSSGSPGHMVMLSGGSNGLQSMGRIMSLSEFAQHRRQQDERVNIRSDAHEEARMQPTRPRLTSTDSNDPYSTRFSFTSPFGRGHRIQSEPMSALAPGSRFLMSLEDDQEELERESMLPSMIRLTSTIDEEREIVNSSSDRLNEVERIDREMEDRRRIEREQADREDLSDLNEWEASQGLPLTRSFRHPPTTERVTYGYAQSFISRVADTAVTSRVYSLTTPDHPIGRSRDVVDEDEDDSPRTNTRRLIDSVASDDD